MRTIVRTTICDRCEAEITGALEGDTIRSTTLRYKVDWFKQVDGELEDKTKRGIKHLCNPCTDSLIAWFQQEGMDA